MIAKVLHKHIYTQMAVILNVTDRNRQLRTNIIVLFRCHTRRNFCLFFYVSSVPPSLGVNVCQYVLRHVNTTLLFLLSFLPQYILCRVFYMSDFNVFVIINVFLFSLSSCYYFLFKLNSIYHRVDGSVAHLDWSISTLLPVPFIKAHFLLSHSYKSKSNNKQQI